MIRLVIADDHAIVRSGLKQVFSLAPDLAVVGEAVNGNEVLAFLRQQVPDLLLLDINMPGLSGPDLITRVRAHWADLPILVLSMHNEVQVAARVLKAGANGYVTKDSEMDVLLGAIRRVAGGGKFIAPELAEKLVFDMSIAGEKPAHMSLSDRELEVFRLLVAGKGINDIAGQLCISNKTVSTYKTRLMEKLNLSGVAELTRYAMQHGLLS
ncbi:MAG: response regulator transcription factor [Pseudomonadota bacterium]|jgi:DNA-binding NarL/FixJ family response regulator|uniref:response regulator n=1 Tax=Curvibacter delicatus TaxID=80879 RepID=UPI000833CEBC|nr:response regulator transcription factor [Curvibacter delicatus]MEA3393383.1 response regulator transcription factor [Pseudomonadota bacterium]